MKLEIGNFYVDNIIFGETTSFMGGTLSINKEKALKVVKEDVHITDADLHIVKPGENVRLVPVKEAIEPRIKLDGSPLFPGVTGDVVPAGHGVTHALKGCSVLVVGKRWGGFQDGLIDMGGEGAKYSYYSKLNNIVLVADTDEDFEKHEQQKKNKALRWAGMRLAEYIGSCLKDLLPEEKEVFELLPVTKRSQEESDFPSVVIVLQAPPVLGMMSSGGNLNPPTKRKLIWGSIQSALALALMLAGGLKMIQTASIVAAFPFAFVMLFGMISIIKALRSEKFE